MLFKFRKIAILALCLVLVCGLSVTAFAITEYSIDEDYDNGNVVAYADAKLDRYYTWGSTEVISYLTEDIPDPDVYVFLTYRFYPDDVTAGIQTYNGSRYDQWYVRTQFNAATNPQNIFAMYDATYRFQAYVPTSYGWSTFQTDSVVLEY